MKCQRCIGDEEVRYRAYSDVLNVKVCVSCAEEARKLGIAVETLDVEKIVKEVIAPASAHGN